MTPSLAGSRSGAVITGTWAALMKQGKQGFIDKAKTLLTAAHNIREAIKLSNGIQLISDHDNTVVSFKSDVANCVAINDRMQKVHRWSLNTI